MKHRSLFLVALVALPVMAVAGQLTPPPPPQPPTPVVVPPVVPPIVVSPSVPTVVVTPTSPLPPIIINGVGLDRFQLDEIRRAGEDARRAADEARREMQFSMQNFKTPVPFEFDSHFNFNFDFPTFGDIGPRPAWA